jgi:hypothetical protein
MDSARRLIKTPNSLDYYDRGMKVGKLGFSLRNHQEIKSSLFEIFREHAVA